MGGAVASLPDKLTEEELKNICGDRYDSAVYESLKDESGFVDKAKFLEASGLGAPPEAAPATGGTPPSHEAEAEHVFGHYCPKGDMESKTYIKLCKDLKFLNKKFTSGAADLVYTKAKQKNGTVTFKVFREEILVDMAGKKGCDVTVLVNKIAASEGPIIHATAADNVRFHDDTSTYTGAVAKNENFKNDVTAAGADENNAALKLQNVHRVKQAKQHVSNLKEIKNHTSSANLLVPIAAPTDETEDEKKLKELFLKFCPNGEMDSRTFIKLCRDCGVVNKTYTGGDADLAFQKTKAAAAHPSAGSYSSGVVHGKRVSYDVFRAIAIPCIAEKKKMEIPALVTFLASQDGPKLNGVTTADAVKFHDDKTTYTGTHEGK